MDVALDAVAHNSQWEGQPRGRNLGTRLDHNNMTDKEFTSQTTGPFQGHHKYQKEIIKPLKFFLQIVISLYYNTSLAVNLEFRLKIRVPQKFQLISYLKGRSMKGQLLKKS